jgi:hypothetical protein
VRAAVRGPAVSNPYAHTNPDSYADALDTPAIACGTSASSNIGIDVTAGDSCAPNGFVVEWMVLADFIANQWPDDPLLVCEANFPYDLTPHQTDVVWTMTDRSVPFACEAISGRPALVRPGLGVPLPSA